METGNEGLKARSLASAEPDGPGWPSKGATLKSARVFARFRPLTNAEKQKSAFVRVRQRLNRMLF
jgi:hypothetical protein